MMDDRFERQLREAAQDYHRPPETPREAIWARIAVERARRRAAPRVLVLQPWLRWGLAAAAVLAVGIGIGRWTAPNGNVARSGAAEDAAAEGAARERIGEVAYRLAATQYLTRTEAFLTDFRARGRSEEGRLEAQFAGAARELLVTTRLMLDSPAAADPRLRALLEELELVLAQITQLGPGRAPADLDFITDGLEQRGVLMKLRTAIPAGPAVGAQGAL